MNPWDIIGWIVLCLVSLWGIATILYFGSAIIAGVYAIIKERRWKKKKGA